MTISERMFDLLENSSGKSAAGLCRELGISTSITTGWKKRNTDPPAKYLTRICEYLGISVIFLLTGEQDQDQIESFSSDEIRLIRKYRLLDEDGKDSVRGVLLQEQRRVESDRGSGSSAVS